MIRGFLNESLTPALAAERGMRPALYVDIDVDIHAPTYEALDWMLRSGLIANGTVIGYDDFNHGVPAGVPLGTKGSWERVREGRLEGEARAHREIEDKWGLRMVQIRSVRNTGGSGGWAFRVVK